MKTLFALLFLALAQLSVNPAFAEGVASGGGGGNGDLKVLADGDKLFCPGSNIFLDCDSDCKKSNSDSNMMVRAERLRAICESHHSLKSE